MYQKTILIGNLGKDPETKFTATGTQITSFSLAVSGRQDETLWFRVSTFGKLAETCDQYLKKGAKVLVEGALKGDPETGSPRVYQKTDGTWGASFEINASTVRFLSSREPEEVQI